MNGNDFPPRSTRRSEFSLFIAIYGTVCDEKAALYVSTPITTGKRLHSWERDSGLTESHPDYFNGLRSQVIEPNIEAATEVVAQLRRRNSLVISPASLKDLPGWTQADYRAFWGEVIARFVREAVFMEGWQYSSGCAYEFLVACRAGVTTLKQDLNPVTLSEALELLEDAATSSDPEVGFRRSVIDSLRTGRV
jgi:hypothetical protein